MGKGVSAADKKIMMLGVFHAGPDVFSKKEIEKQKWGFPPQAADGVLKELMCDDLVREAKIGGSNFYWSFPNEAASKKRAALASAQAGVAKQAEQLEKLRQQVEEAQKATGVSPDDATRMRDAEQSITEYKKREADAKGEMERVKKAGAQNMGLRKKDLPQLRDAANRWTDNCFELRKYLLEKHNMEPSKADHELGITDNFDYVG